MNCVQRSITEKWEPILRGQAREQGWMNCPCCSDFYDNDCHGCPIADHTGVAFCENTPYAAYLRLKREFFYGDVAELHAELTACAQWEIDFLHEVLEASRVNTKRIIS